MVGKKLARRGSFLGNEASRVAIIFATSGIPVAYISAHYHPSVRYLVFPLPSPPLSFSRVSCEHSSSGWWGGSSLVRRPVVQHTGNATRGTPLSFLPSISIYSYSRLLRPLLHAGRPANPRCYALLGDAHAS